MCMYIDAKLEIKIHFTSLHLTLSKSNRVNKDRITKPIQCRRAVYINYK